MHVFSQINFKLNPLPISHYVQVLHRYLHRLSHSWGGRLEDTHIMRNSWSSAPTLSIKSCTWNWELILYGRHAIYTEIMLPKVLAAQFHFTLNTHHFTMDIHPEKTNKQKPRNQRSTGSVRMILWCWFSSVFWTQSQNEDFAARWGEMKMSWIHSKQCSHSCLTFKKISPSSS